MLIAHRVQAYGRPRDCHCIKSFCDIRNISEGREFYSVVDGTFASMLNLLSAVKERIGARFVGAFDDDKVSKILNLPD